MGFQIKESIHPFFAQEIVDYLTASWRFPSASYSWTLAGGPSSFKPWRHPILLAGQPEERVVPRQALIKLMALTTTTKNNVNRGNV